jgi:hypothetical protein
MADIVLEVHDSSINMKELVEAIDNRAQQRIEEEGANNG